MHIILGQITPCKVVVKRLTESNKYYRRYLRRIRKSKSKSREDETKAIKNEVQNNNNAELPDRRKKHLVDVDLFKNFKIPKLSKPNRPEKVKPIEGLESPKSSHESPNPIGDAQPFVNLIFIFYARWRFKIVCLQTKFAKKLISLDF